MRRARTGLPTAQPWALLAGTVTTLVAVAVVLAGSWGSGLILFRDDVQVPRPVWNDAVWGLGVGPPRAVPFGAVVVALSHLLGAGVAQRLLLAAPLLLAGSGVALLLRRHGAAACSVGALAAVWNPYVAERLGLGQAPTLLAYGALPWLVVAARASRRRVWLNASWCTLAFLPAALTPIGAVTGLVVLAVAVVIWRRPPAAVGAALVAPILLCSTWVAGALAATVVTGTPDGAAAFAARDDTGWGTLVSVATLGGVWAPAAAPGSRHSALAVVAAIGLLLLAALGAWRVRSRAVWLALAWAVPVVGVALAATQPGIRLLAAVQGVPGASLVRDTHRLLAPSAVALAVGLGLLAGGPVRRFAAAAMTRRLATAGVLLGVGGLVVGAVADLPATVAARYVPRAIPPDWQAAVRRVDASQTGVLSMPWQPLRRTSWSGGQPFLDPLDRAVHGTVLHSTQLVVQRDGSLLVTDADQAGTSVAQWARGLVSADDLSARGVGWVLEYRGTPGPPVVAAPGLSVVLEGPSVRLWQVDRAVSSRPDPPYRLGVIAAWLVSGVAVLLALAVALVDVVATRTSGLRGERLPQTPTDR